MVPWSSCWRDRSSSRLKLWSIVVIQLCLLSCGEPVAIDKLYGEWMATYNWGTDTIDLRQDGTYAQVVTITKTGERTKNSGAWEFHADSEEVDLGGCLQPNDGFGNLREDYATPLDGGCTYPVERDSVVGSRLRLGADEGSPHRKIE